MEDEFKHLVRISRKDVSGNKTIEHALTEIKGVGISLSKTMCRVLDLDLDAKNVNRLTEDEIENDYSIDFGALADLIIALKKGNFSSEMK